MSHNTNVADNIRRLRDAISDAAVKSGRAPDEIKLVAASKTQPAGLIRQAIAAGVDAVGENRVQELTQKIGQGAYRGAPLHFIGHLQSNKVNKIVGVCDLIESVGSKALVEQIGRRADSLGIVQETLLEVNIGREPGKSGALPEQAEEIMEAASRTPGINLLGMMAIPPFFTENERNCYYFDLIYKLFVDIREKKYDNVSMQILSMGMSDSFLQAIRSGSNMVRLGTAIFGSRT